MVRISNVTMKYNRDDGLERVNLAIGNGEFVFLVGPSGAGKSTVLRLIYMDVCPTDGQVTVGRYNSATIKKRDIPYLRRKIGVVFQDFKLLDDRNVFENVAFALRVTGARRRDIKKKVLRILTDVGLNHKRNKMPHHLSGGEQQRVAIARALVNEPFILLADEPTGNLDPEASQNILELLKKINSRGTAILMATHDYQLVKKLGKRIIRIEKGRTLT
ncbi:cell division ATP-binding protein FtsE [candidate division KSB1 bacterium]|nr:cell division ATP-binding protein FtsE [candidate division KSB1 bacterium]